MTFSMLIRPIDAGLAACIADAPARYAKPVSARNAQHRARGQSERRRRMALMLGMLVESDGGPGADAARPGPIAGCRALIARRSSHHTDRRAARPRQAPRR